MQLYIYIVVIINLVNSISSIYKLSSYTLSIDLIKITRKYVPKIITMQFLNSMFALLEISKNFCKTDVEKKENKDTEYKKFKQHVQTFCYFIYTYIYTFIYTYIFYMHAGI